LQAIESRKRTQKAPLLEQFEQFLQQRARLEQERNDALPLMKAYEDYKRNAPKQFKSHASL